MLKSLLKPSLKAIALSTVAVGAMATAQAQTEPLYLSDVATEAELTSDIFGVPMRIDNVGNYQYVAHYYNQVVNNPIYILATKTSFGEAYGLMDGTLAFGSVDELDPIILPEANTYYQIDLNTDDMDYKVTSYKPEDYMDPVIYEQGSDNLNTWWSWVDTGTDDWVPTPDDENGEGGAWMQEFYIGMMTENPENVIKFAVDANNPHHYYLPEPVHYEAGENINLAIHNWHSHGWWNYCTWRVDDDIECDIFYYYGGVVKKAYLDWAWGEGVVDWAKWVGSEDYRKEFVPDNWCHTPVVNSGDYILEFDSHLGRAKLILAGTGGISDITMNEAEGAVEYYNLQGVRINGDALTPGYYIKRQGLNAKKVLIK